MSGSLLAARRLFPRARDQRLILPSGMRVELCTCDDLQRYSPTPVYCSAVTSWHARPRTVDSITPTER